MGQHDFAGQLVGTNFVVIQTRLGLADPQNALRHLLGAERDLPSLQLIPFDPRSKTRTSPAFETLTTVLPSPDAPTRGWS